MLPTTIFPGADLRLIYRIGGSGYFHGIRRCELMNVTEGRVGPPPPVAKRPKRKLIEPARASGKTTRVASENISNLTP